MDDGTQRAAGLTDHAGRSSVWRGRARSLMQGTTRCGRGVPSTRLSRFAGRRGRARTVGACANGLAPRIIGGTVAPILRVHVGSRHGARRRPHAAAPATRNQMAGCGVHAGSSIARAIRRGCSGPFTPTRAIATPRNGVVRGSLVPRRPTCRALATAEASSRTDRRGAWRCRRARALAPAILRPQ